MEYICWVCHDIVSEIKPGDLCFIAVGLLGEHNSSFDTGFQVNFRK